MKKYFFIWFFLLNTFLYSMNRKNLALNKKSQIVVNNITSNNKINNNVSDDVKKDDNKVDAIVIKPDIKNNIVDSELENKRIAGLVDDYIKKNPPSEGITKKDIIESVVLLLAVSFGVIGVWHIGKYLKSVNSEELSKTLKKVSLTTENVKSFFSGKENQEYTASMLEQINKFLDLSEGNKKLIRGYRDLFSEFVQSPASMVSNLLKKKNSKDYTDAEKLIIEFYDKHKDEAMRKQFVDKIHNHIKEIEAKL